MQVINNEYHNNVHVKPKTKWEGILTQMKYFKKMIEILLNQKFRNHLEHMELNLKIRNIGIINKKII